MIDWSWIVENWQQIGQLLVDHIQLVTLGLCIGMLLAGAMVLLTLWQPGLARPMIYVCGILFTIPSLALFILIMPFTGLSKTTAVIGLSLYSLLIVLQNTLAGLASNPATYWRKPARSGIRACRDSSGLNFHWRCLRYWRAYEQPPSRWWGW